MKANALITLGLAGLITASTSTVFATQPPKMKKTTDIPPGIAIADKLDTLLGTLNFFDGVPDAATEQKVLDNLKLQHGRESK